MRSIKQVVDAYFPPAEPVEELPVDEESICILNLELSQFKFKRSFEPLSDLLGDYRRIGVSNAQIFDWTRQDGFIIKQFYAHLGKGENKIFLLARVTAILANGEIDDFVVVDAASRLELGTRGR